MNYGAGEVSLRIGDGCVNCYFRLTFEQPSKKNKIFSISIIKVVVGGL